MKILNTILLAGLFAASAHAAILGAPFMPEEDVRFDKLERNPTLTGIVTAPTLVITNSATPASNAACTAGKIVWDASYVYVCTASGAWKRAALTGGY